MAWSRIGEMAEQTLYWDQLVALFDKIPALSPFWQWAALALGFFGAVFGLMQTFQMIFGRPKLEISAQTKNIEDGKGLTCFVKNPSVNKYLKRLGVNRLPAQILCDFSVYEAGTLKPLYEYIRVQVNTDQGGATLQATIHPDWPGRCILIIAMKDRQEAYLQDDGNDKQLPLQPGIYLLKFTASLLGGEATTFEQSLCIGDSYLDLRWK